MTVEETLEKLRNLDHENPGTWPLPFKIATWFCLYHSGFFGFQFVLGSLEDTLASKERLESELKQNSRPRLSGGQPGYLPRPDGSDGGLVW